MIALFLAACTYGQPILDSSAPCTIEQTIEIVAAQDSMIRLDLDGSRNEVIPRVEACTYSAYWLCVPCDVMLYGTDPDMEPYPDNAQAIVQDCSTTATAYRVTRQTCEE